MQSFGQDTGYVFKQAAAGDMRQRTDSPAMNKRQQRLHIDSGGSHQGIDQQNILIEQSGTLQLPALVSGKAADQRKAVGMNAGGSEAKKHVSVRDPGSGQGLLPLNRTDARSEEHTSELQSLMRITSAVSCLK